MRIEFGIPTKDRYDQLGLLLWSLLEQTYKQWDVTIVDDSEHRTDLREISFIWQMLKLMDKRGNSWRVFFGNKKGPHHSHNLVLKESKNPYIFRVDDDTILDHKCLEDLVITWKDVESKFGKVGGVGPIITEPSTASEIEWLPVHWESYKKYQGKVDDHGMGFGDHQWRRHPDKNLQKVEHLYSSFLYSKEAGDKVGGYDLNYNVVGHREETDFTYRIFKEGYNLFVNPNAIIWHLRNPKGGIRTYSDGSLWGRCHEYYLDKFKFKRGKYEDKVLKLFGGMGDTLCATPMIRNITDETRISVIYPSLLAGNPNIDELVYWGDCEQYSNVVDTNIYKWGFENNFDGKVSEAWCRAYGVSYDNDELDYNIDATEFEAFNTKYRNLWGEKFIVISPWAGIPAISYGDATVLGEAKKRTEVKDWFEDRWIDLVSELSSKGFLVYQVGGKSEKLIKGCRDFRGIDVRTTMLILQACNTFISVDTFLGHAGHTVRKKGIVLFGPSDPKIFGHDSNINIRHPEACSVNYKCLQGKEARFQWLSHQYGCEFHDCMKCISVDEVMKELTAYVIV